MIPEKLGTFSSHIICGLGNKNGETVSLKILWKIHWCLIKCSLLNSFKMVNNRKWYFKGSNLTNNGLTGAFSIVFIKKLIESFLKETWDVYLSCQRNRFADWRPQKRIYRSQQCSLQCGRGDRMYRLTKLLLFATEEWQAPERISCYVFPSLVLPLKEPNLEEKKLWQDERNPIFSCHQIQMFLPSLMTDLN